MICITSRFEPSSLRGVRNTTQGDRDGEGRRGKGQCEEADQRSKPTCTIDVDQTTLTGPARGAASMLGGKRLKFYRDENRAVEENEVYVCVINIWRRIFFSDSVRYNPRRSMRMAIAVSKMHWSSLGRGGTHS